MQILVVRRTGDLTKPSSCGTIAIVDPPAETKFMVTDQRG
jgi:hypothetical protein